MDMIGRTSEAAAIARFAQQVPNGPVGLLIEGEAGIGKTTLVREVIRRASEAGCRVLHIRPAEAEADLSHAALADLVGGLFDDVSGVLPAPQRQALEVALLRREAGANADPRTTATALLTVVTLLSQREPLVIVIDDAQWLDHASKRAFEFVARRLPPRVGFVVAQRPVARLRRPVDLARALAPQAVQHLALGPLSLAALNELIKSRVRLKLPRPLLVRLAEACEGNPFFALEIAGALARGPALPAPGDPLPIPRTLHDLLSDRFARLSAPARMAATGAAALSRPSADSLETAFGSEFNVEAAVLELEEAGLLISDDDRLRFSHPLLASTLYGSLTVARRRELHRRLAVAAGDPEEQARHLARAQRVPDEGAAATIEAAAALAARRAAPEAAAELYAAACRLTPEERSEDRARRLLAGAQALSLAGDLDAARSRATEALESSRTPSIRASTLLLLGDLATYTESIESRLEYQERALKEAGGNSGLRVEILLALFEQIATDAESAGQRADEAVELLRQARQRPALARALISKFIAEAVLGRGAQTHLLDEALALDARVENDLEDRIHPGPRGGPISIYPLIWCHWIDDLEGTRTRFHVLSRRFEESGDIVGAAELVEFLAMAEFRAGNWREAERALEAACDTLAQFELRGPLIASFADRSVIDAHRAKIERARETLDTVLAVDGLDRFWRMVALSARGAVEFCAGSYEAADRAWAQMRDDARIVGWIDNLDDRSEPDHVEALIALGRLDDARGVLEHLEWRGRTLPRSWIDAGLPRAQALILAAEGNVAEALVAIDEAKATPSLPFESARLLLLRGQLERRANRKLAARESLAGALRAFEELGSPPWAQRASDEIARLGLRHRGPHELTDSERRIAELAASGKTNRQVAEAAFVSPKTVEANLARVYQKLGIRSRAELGARMTASSRGADTQT
jgi:ATP/maltotriose-dependent transcriptional regulator MalT